MSAFLIDLSALTYPYGAKSQEKPRPLPGRTPSAWISTNVMGRKGRDQCNCPQKQAFTLTFGPMGAKLIVDTIMHVIEPNRQDRGILLAKQKSCLLIQIAF